MTTMDWRSIGRDRRVRWLGGLLIAAVLIGLAAAWIARGDFKGKYAVPALGADRNGVVAQQAAPAPSAAPVALAPPASVAPRAQATPAPLPPPPIVAEEDGPPPDADQAPSDPDRMARAIDKAARKALDRGEPVRWHKAGEEGYVVVSDERDYGNRACRNVSATINSDNGPTQSSSHLWCTTPDGDWAPAE
jgi:hypothetical protein